MALMATMNGVNFIIIIAVGFCMARGSLLDTLQNTYEGTFSKTFVMNITGLRRQTLVYANSLNCEEVKKVTSILDIVWDNLKENCSSASENKICQPTSYYCDVALKSCESCSNLCRRNRVNGIEGVQLSCKENCEVHLLQQDLHKILDEKENEYRKYKVDGSQDSNPWKILGIMLLCMNTFWIVIIGILVHVTRTIGTERPRKWVQKIYYLLGGKKRERVQDVLLNQDIAGIDVDNAAIPVDIDPVGPDNGPIIAHPQDN